VRLGGEIGGGPLEGGRLPFRNERGGIMFPPNVVGGRYMRDDAINALKFFDRFNTELRDYGTYRAGPRNNRFGSYVFYPPPMKRRARCNSSETCSTGAPR
jgi:hypothetical protein